MRSVSGEPTATRCELTVVVSFGTASTLKLSAGAPQAVVSPTWTASLGTTSTKVYHPALAGETGGVVYAPGPFVVNVPCQAGAPSQRTFFAKENGPYSFPATVAFQPGAAPVIDTLSVLSSPTGIVPGVAVVEMPIRRLEAAERRLAEISCVA